MENLLLVEENKKNANFSGKLADLWEIRKSGNSIFEESLPEDFSIRKAVMDFLSTSQIFDFDQWIWAVSESITSNKPIMYKNFSLGNFYKPREYLEKYSDVSIQRNDKILKFIEYHPNTSVRKFNLIDPSEYRKSSFYREHVIFHNMEDGIVSNIKDPITGNTTFFCIYREGKSIQHFFTQDEEDRHLFITKLLSFSPKYPIVICNSKGKIHYKDKGGDYSDGFLDLCKQEFPEVKHTQNLPAKLLANLISWNRFAIEKQVYKCIKFKVIHYDGIYCIQATPRLIGLYTKENISSRNVNNQKITKRYNLIKPLNIESNCADKTEHRYSEKNIPFFQILLEENIKLKHKLKIIEKHLKIIEKENINLIARIANQAEAGEIVPAPNKTGSFILQPPKVALVPFKGKQSQSLDFLEQHYGQYLTYFGSPRDVLFQYQLKKIDSKLYLSLAALLNYKRKKYNSQLKLAKILPPKSKETDMLLQKAPEKERLAMYRLHKASRYRATPDN